MCPPGLRPRNRCQIQRERRGTLMYLPLGGRAQNMHPKFFFLKCVRRPPHGVGDDGHILQLRMVSDQTDRQSDRQTYGEHRHWKSPSPCQHIPRTQTCFTKECSNQTMPFHPSSFFYFVLKTRRRRQLRSSAGTA